MGMPKTKRVKDFPTGMPITVTNVRPKVIKRRESITLNSLNSVKGIPLLKKNSQSSTNKAIFPIHFHVIPTVFI